MAMVEIVETFLTRWFIQNWPQKLISIILAVLIWVFVNQSITATKTIPFVPVRIINLPADKTILGLQPNGYLQKRISLTISGTKDVVEDLEPGDLEILLDAADQPDQWIVTISKKNLVSLNPELDLTHHITSVSHNEFVIKLSRFITEEIPLTISCPKGKAPAGYQFVGIWPQHLTQSVSGPEEQVLAIKNKGLEVTFDLDEITSEQLDTLRTSPDPLLEDEVSFLIPNKWKKIAIPFLNDSSEPMNDPMAKYLQIDFLRKGIHPLGTYLPVRIFYPLKSLAALNPETLTLSPSDLLKKENGIFVLEKRLYAQNLSKLFLHIVQDYLSIDIIAGANGEKEELPWSLEMIDSDTLENAYASYLLLHEPSPQKRSAPPEVREPQIRQRFREYHENLSLWVSNTQPLALENRAEKGVIIVQEAGQKSMSP